MSHVTKMINECGKVAFKSQLDASLILELKMRRKGAKRTYKCDRCGLYHITSKPKK